MEENRLRQQAQEVVEKVKELVKKGNISQILVKRNDETVLSLPLNVGIVGAILGVKAAPWALLLTALVSFGMKCRLELVKTDGKTVDINGKTIGKAADSLGETVREKLRNLRVKSDDPSDGEPIEVEPVEVAPTEDAAAEDEPAEESPAEDGTE